MTLSRRTVDRVGLALVLAIALGFAATVTLWGIAPARQAAAERETFERAVGILTDAETGMTGLADEVASVRASLEGAEGRLPSAFDLESFLQSLQQTAAGAEVRIEGLTPGGSRDRGLFREQRVALRVVGSYTGVYRFLSAIEYGEQLALVDRLNLIGDSPGGAIAADLNLVIYSAGEPS